MAVQFYDCRLLTVEDFVLKALKPAATKRNLEGYKYIEVGYWDIYDDFIEFYPYDGECISSASVYEVFVDLGYKVKYKNGIFYLR